MTKTTLLALAAGAALLTACGSGDTTTPVVPVVAPQPAATAPAPAAAAAAAPGALPAAVPDPGATVDADDQSGDGRTVVVREARITAGPGWVVIRIDDDDDRPGRVLGRAPLAPGRTGPVTVTLTEPVPAGTSDDDDLTAVLHLDDGDGAFDERTDPAVLDDDDGDRDDDDDRDDDGDRDDVEDDDFDYRVA